MRASTDRREALVLRAAVIRNVRAYFDGEGFVEVDTPVLVRAPGLEPHLDAFPVTGGFYLNTSPEYQMKRMLAGGFRRIYQIGHAFRRGEAGRTHNPEFTMLEWYRTDATTADIMRDCEALLGGDAPYERLTMRDAWEKHAGGACGVTVPALREKCEALGIRYDQGDAWDDLFFRVFVERIEPRIGRDRPTFLTDYPASMAALARLNPADPTTADRFELYAGGVELVNAFGELTDAAEQRQRFESDIATRRARGLAVTPIDEKFLAALEAGLPACAGAAMGIERLLMLKLGKTDIREVMAFTFDEL